jgi:hypothetical protein
MRSDDFNELQHDYLYIYCGWFDSAVDRNLHGQWRLPTSRGYSDFHHADLGARRFGLTQALEPA